MIQLSQQSTYSHFQKESHQSCHQDIKKLRLCWSEEKRSNLFECQHNGPQLNPQIHRKCISWFMNLCGSQGTSEVAMWNSISLYYIYSAQYSIEQQQLEALLLICLQLSSKVIQKTYMTMRTILQTISRPISIDTLGMFQERILKVTDFNVIVFNNLTLLLYAEGISQQTMRQSMFLCQVKLIQNAQVLFDENLVNGIYQLVEGKGQQQLVWDISALLNDPNCQVLGKKYESYFDIDAFLYGLQ